MARVKRCSWLAAGLALLLAACQTTPPQSAAMDPAALNRAVMLLAAQSKSSDPTVRANCIEALQLAPDPRVPEIIERALHDPEWVVRFAAAMASGKRKTQLVGPILRNLVITDPNSSVRVACVYALSQMGDTTHMNLLARTLDSPDVSARANTALVLGLLKDPSAIALLQAHHEDPDVRVRFELTSAMARLGDEAAQKVIVSWAISRFAEDQWSAMMVCGDLPEAVAGHPLLMGLEPFPKLPATLPAEYDRLTTQDIRDLTTQRQLVAARSLAKLGSLQGADTAVLNLTNPNPGLRALAYLAMGEILAPPGLPRILPGLDDQDPAVQRAAAAAVINVAIRAARLR